MATFGSFPGVQVETTGGSITGVAVGREQNLIIIGHGDASAGNASVNTATNINSSSDADRKFGSDSELAEALKQALDNEANINFLYGVMLDTSTASNEAVSQSDTLSNFPIIEDTSLIDVNDDGGDNPELELRYDSPPSTPSTADTVYLNPSTGEIEFDAVPDGSYEIEYDYPDWSTAIDEAQTVIDVEEHGVITALDESESVASSLVEAVDDLREDYKMALGHSGAEHNDNTSDNDASIDTASYEDNIDNDAYFISGPVRLADSNHTVLGGISGHMAGSSLNDAVYNETLQSIGDDLEQNISESEATDLRDEEIIPIRQTQPGSPIDIKGNVSTSTEDDWVRDLYTRRIVDRVTLISKTLGDTIIGKINNEDNRTSTEDAIEAELRDLARQSLIKSNTADEDYYFVTVYDTDTQNEVGIDIGITPTGIVKQADVSITIDTS